MAALTDTGDLQISNLCSIVHVFVAERQGADPPIVQPSCEHRVLQLSAAVAALAERLKSSSPAPAVSKSITAPRSPRRQLGMI
jgi:hypothetical protein